MVLKKGWIELIITFDDDKNVLLGDLVVKDKKGLKEIRDYLMSGIFSGKYRNYTLLSKTNEVALGDLAMPGVSRYHNVLIRKSNFCADYYNGDIENFVYDYDKEMIRCESLNSILIFSSLLGELSNSKQEAIVRDFIATGIFRYFDFEQIWDRCSHELLLKENQLDLLKFRSALQVGVIDYQVSDKLLEKDLRQMNVLKKLNVSLNEVILNSKVIGTNRSLCYKK